MTVSAITLTNPGGETGTTAGWTARSGDTFNVFSGGAHSGSWKLGFDNGFSENSTFDQDVAVPGALEAAIDADTAAIKLTAYKYFQSETGYIFAKFYDSGMVLLDTAQTGSSGPSSWTLDTLYAVIPSGTRTIRIGALGSTGGFSSGSWFDDFTLDISDDRETDWYEFFAAHAKQLGTYALANYISDEARALQLPIAILGAAETSSGFHDVTTYQAGAYALVRGKIDRRDLRAWPFTQDDHDFYVLQLGDVGTLVFDKLTGQWAQWRSPGYVYWRGNDGVQWEGWNICCDTESGTLWIIDPEGRLDDETTPITSIITGGINTRMRKFLQNYMAELTISEGQPPTGIDASTVGITLRVSDDQGQNYTNHGEVAGEAIGEDITVRWYGLGVIPPAGRVYEITDTGYARRIDAFTIEVGDDPVG